MRGPIGRRAAAALVATTALAVVVSPGSSRAGADDDADALRRADAALAQRARSAALELYGLESALVQARGRLARTRSALAAATAERRSAVRQLRVARATSVIAERRLVERLQAHYMTGSVDPVEVLLGASSLDEAISRVNTLEAVAEHDRAILDGARAARARLAVLTGRLEAREARLVRLEEAAAGRAASLADAAAERRAYVAELAERRRLGAERIAQLERAAAARARSPAAPAAPPRPDPAPESESTSAATAETHAATAAAPAPPSGLQTLTVVVTGYALRGSTASGVPVGWGVAAVDPAVIPLGSRMTIPGYGEAVAADTGGSVHGATVDVWFPSVAQALRWGRRTVTITVH